MGQSRKIKQDQFIPFVNSSIRRFDRCADSVDSKFSSIRSIRRCVDWIDSSIRGRVRFDRFLDSSIPRVNRFIDWIDSSMRRVVHSIDSSARRFVASINSVDSVDAVNVNSTAEYLPFGHNVKKNVIQTITLNDVKKFLSTIP